MSWSEVEAQAEAAREAYRREVEEETLASIRKNSINCYFFYYGDDIEARIQRRIDAANQLLASRYYGESLTNSVIAIELTIRWFLLRPLCEASFMSEEVADILVNKILPSRTSGADRQILPNILREWGCDLDKLRLKDGTGLWDKFVHKCVPARNAFIHQGANVERLVAEIAADSAESLLGKAIEIVSQFKTRGKDGWGSPDSRRTLDDL
jgi:hypothetical protein